MRRLKFCLPLDRLRADGGISLKLIQLRITVRRPVDEVWEHIVDPAYAPRWMSGVVDAGLTGERPIGVGTEFRKVQRFYGLRTELIYEVTEYEPHSKVGYRTAFGPLFYQASIALRDVEGNAELTYHARAKLRGFFKLAEPIFVLVARQRFGNDFKKLKTQLEGPAGIAGRQL